MLAAGVNQDAAAGFFHVLPARLEGVFLSPSALHQRPAVATC